MKQNYYFLFLANQIHESNKNEKNFIPLCVEFFIVMATCCLTFSTNDIYEHSFFFTINVIKCNLFSEVYEKRSPTIPVHVRRIHLHFFRTHFFLLLVSSGYKLKRLKCTKKVRKHWFCSFFPSNDQKKKRKKEEDKATYFVR